MPESVQNIIDYLIGVQFHPVVTAVVFIVIAVGKQRWEEAHVVLAKQAIIDASQAAPDQAAAFMQIKYAEATKADQVGNVVMLVGFIVSILGEFALYWPKSGQARAICVFMSFAQIGAAWVLYFYLDKWGIADRLGVLVQKKIEQKVGA